MRVCFEVQVEPKSTREKMIKKKEKKKRGYCTKKREHMYMGMGCIKTKGSKARAESAGFSFSTAL